MTATRRPPTVHKFGGASLADAAAMHQAVAVIQDLPPGPAVIVASAMAGVTDRLLGLARNAADGKPGESADFATLRRQHVDAARQIIRTPVRAGWCWRRSRRRLMSCGPFSTDCGSSAN